MPPRQDTCDFDALSVATWRYECGSFQVIEDGWENGDPKFPGSTDWAACDRCAELVERKEQNALVEVGLFGPHRKPPNARDMFARKIAGFFKNYTGTRRRLDGGKCDMCARPPVWEYPCADFTLDGVPGFEKWTSVGMFAACAGCAALIEANNWDGLVKRHTDTRAPEVRPYITPFVAKLYRAFRQHRNGPRRAVLHIEDAPIPNVGPYSQALIEQLRLRDWWSGPHALAFLDRARTTDGADAWDIDRVRSIGRQMANELDRAATYYVSPDIARFLAESSQTVPDDAVFRSDDLPAPTGFLYLSEPLLTPCTSPSTHQDDPRLIVPGSGAYHSPAYHRVRAIAWHFEPPGSEARDVLGYSGTIGDDSRPHHDHSSVIVNVYADSARGETVFRDQFSWPEGSGVASPMRAYAGTTLDDPREGPRALIDPVRRVLVEAWTFISQRVADEAERRANSLTRKRLRKESPEPSDEYRPIRIVYLRQTERREASPTVTIGSERHYSVRWIRRPHRRHVRFGPGRTERKLVWFGAQLCGPRTPDRDSLPLKSGRALYVVNR